MQFTPHRKLFLLLAVALAFPIAGCRLYRDYDQFPGLEECEPGEVRDCSCESGTGTQTCTETGELDVCSCEEPRAFRPLDGPTFDSVAVGALHTCAVDTEGDIECWGSDGDGQLGLQEARANLTFVSVGAGGRHSCAVTANEGVVCWGSNTDGERGRQINEMSMLILRSILWENDEASPVQRVALGDSHSVAFTTDGALAAWGDSDFRQSRPNLEDAEALTEPIPRARVPGFATGPYSRFSVGGRHTCGVDEDGNIDCWGWNEHAQLGFESCAPNEPPCNGENRWRVIEGDFRDVGAGLLHTCAIDNVLTVSCWGNGRRGQLGVGVREDASPDPVQPDVPASISSLGRSLGETQCGWNDTGQVVCWGDNRRGQADPTSPDEVVEPRIVALPEEATWVGSGISHTCALLRSGHVRCWGADGDGQLAEFALYE